MLSEPREVDTNKCLSLAISLRWAHCIVVGSNHADFGNLDEVLEDLSVFKQLLNDLEEVFVAHEVFSLNFIPR